MTETITIEQFVFKYLTIDGSWDYIEGKINIVGNVTLRPIRQIPFKFGFVTGDFNADRCLLDNMMNFPDVINGSLSARSNNFTIIMKLPKVGKNIVLNCNKKLTNIPNTEVFADLDISHCDFTSLSPVIVHGNLIANDNRFTVVPESAVVEGDAIFSNNKILNCNNKNIKGKIDLSNNPITADEDDLKEKATWG